MWLRVSGVCRGAYSENANNADIAFIAPGIHDTRTDDST